MPFYEYRRRDGTTFEVMQSMSDPQLTEDPETGEPVERVFHPIAVHFKGKGFYNTDYGTRNRQRETAEQGSGESGGKAESKSKSESKSKDSAKPASGASDSKSKPKPSSSKAD